MRKRFIPTQAEMSQVQSTTQEQVAKGGATKSYDPVNFPVWNTPIDQDKLIYIPRTMIRSVDNTEVFDYMKVIAHNTKQGRMFGSERCIKSLCGNEFFDRLGYDGSCPFCDAMDDVWNLYNKKLEIEGARLGIDPQNDTNDTLKGFKDNLLKDFPIQSASTSYIFPIVEIPNSPSNPREPLSDAADSMKAYFICLSEKKFVDGLLKDLEDYSDGSRTHPAGLVWLFRYSYTHVGKQANAKESGKALTFKAQGDQTRYASLIEKAEELAKEFTLEKAYEMVVAAEFNEMTDVKTRVDALMMGTRTQLAALNAVPVSVASAQLPAQAKAQAQVAGNTPEAQLAAFGASKPQNAGAQSMPQQYAPQNAPQQQQYAQSAQQYEQSAPQQQQYAQSAPQNIGVQSQAQPTAFPGAVGAPIKFN